jgi:hypothetical protein
MTGRYNTRYGMQSGVLKPAKAYSVPLNETLMPEALKLGLKGTKQVKAHAVGKW